LLLLDAMMENTELTYRQAMEEMENILREMESGTPDLDELSLKAKRVQDLLHFCKTKLRDTQDHIQQIMDQMND